jgi:hypothetical protein
MILRKDKYADKILRLAKRRQSNKPRCIKCTCYETNPYVGLNTHSRRHVF